LDQSYYARLRSAPKGSWEEFALQSFEQQKLPNGFPLRHTPREYLSTGELFVTDRARWRESPETAAETEAVIPPAGQTP